MAPAPTVPPPPLTVLVGEEVDMLALGRERKISEIQLQLLVSVFSGKRYKRWRTAIQGLFYINMIINRVLRSLIDSLIFSRLKCTTTPRLHVLLTLLQLVHSEFKVGDIQPSCCSPWRGRAPSCGELPGTARQSAALLGCHKRCSQPETS